MKPLLLGLSCIACATAASAPTFLASKSVSPKNKITPPQSPTPLRHVWNGKISELNSAKDILEEYANTECLDEYFKKINKSTTAPELKGYSDNTTFSQQTTSCLIVEYYKQPYKGGKWWGELKLMWALKDSQNKQGFISVVNVKTKLGNLVGSSAAYILKEDSGTTSWTISHKKETEERNITDKNNLDKLVPQADKVTGETDKTNYWGFTTNLENMCGSDNCKDPEGSHTISSKLWNFKVDNAQTTIIKSWGQNVDKWLKDNFELSNFTNKLSNIKGTWEQKSAS